MKMILALLIALVSSLAQAASVTLAWTASTDPATASYTMRCGLSAGQYTLTQNAGNVTTYTVTGLNDGATYFCAVFAEPSGTDVAHLESVASNEVSATTAGTTPPPPSTADFGEQTVFTTPDSGNGNLVLAQGPYTVSSCPLASLSFYTTNAGNVRLGAYKDASGKPGALVAQTAAFSAAAGWNTKPPSAAVTLAAGAYWLAYLPADGALAFVKGGSGPSYYAPQAYTSGMPATFPVTVSTAADHWSLYASCGTVTPPPNPAPVVAFSAVPLSGNYPLAVQFTNASTNSTSWAWTFGDGGTSTAANPAHSYATAGNYTVTLVATGAGGSTTLSKVGMIAVTSPVVPPAGILAAPVLTLIPHGIQAALQTQWYPPQTVQPVSGTLTLGTAAATGCSRVADAVKGVQMTCDIGWKVAWQSVAATVKVVNGTQTAITTKSLIIGLRNCVVGPPISCAMPYSFAP